MFCWHCCWSIVSDFFAFRSHESKTSERHPRVAEASAREDPQVDEQWQQQQHTQNYEGLLNEVRELKSSLNEVRSEVRSCLKQLSEFATIVNLLSENSVDISKFQELEAKVNLC